MSFLKCRQQNPLTIPDENTYVDHLYSSHRKLGNDKSIRQYFITCWLVTISDHMSWVKGLDKQ